MILHKLYTVVHDTYESTGYPVVRHIFYGRTQEEAERYYAAHKKTDAFLRDCEAQGRWNGIVCRTKISRGTA